METELAIVVSVAMMDKEGDCNSLSIFKYNLKMNYYIII